MKLRTPLAMILIIVAAGCTAVPLPGPTTTPEHSTPPGTTTTTTPGPTTTSPTFDGPQVTVVNVIDGDTMDVKYANGTVVRVRLLGVDTPEPYAEVTPYEWGVPDSPAGRDCLRTWADRASSYAKQELAGETVTLVMDPISESHGGYGRLLAYLAYNGSTFNRRLLVKGYARFYDSQFSRHDEFAAVEARAQRKGLGVWTCRTPQDDTSGDSSGDSTDATISISVHPDAAGPDGENLNDEYVTLTNTGSNPLTITGWTIGDATYHSYTFASLTIQPGESVTLHTGSGTSTATDLYWHADGPLWNNGGDVVTIRNDAGEIVAQTSY